MSDAASPQRSPERVDQLLFGSLAGLSVAFLLQLVDKEPTFTSFLYASLFCFALALPLLVSSFLLEVARPGETKRPPRMLFDLAGVLLALAGFVLLFFHIHIVAGSIFLAAVCVCFIVVVRALR